MSDSKSIKQQIINAFTSEFGFMQDKFEILDLLSNGSPMDYKTIEYLKLPSEDINIVWHPGVYVFIGNNVAYRVGVSMNNSRARVMQHLDVRTQKDGYCVWDINQYEDKSILLFNVKNKVDKHWLLALEVFLETKFQPKIKAGRIG
ncbi:hypothetical protein [Carboxylicivirga sp. N1Y90]|uniref:hypothetical protein n=1 Tax=Carboxylicivirga fragile TaxID=3417571 RepID=UPI003D34EF87|nr:hypothetical protein [Marinilabiliaceae bacterium N1Y90]